MYERPFKLKIIAPDKVVFDGTASSMSAAGVCGGFQVLARHAPLLSQLEIGPIAVKDPSGQDTVFAASGGFAEVRGNTVVVLVESAERAAEIDVQRAREAEKRATRRLEGNRDDIDVDRARAALLRALNRLRVAAKE
jgi:F-type H+-transporting ATPase subunit epsilon